MAAWCIDQRVRKYQSEIKESFFSTAVSSNPAITLSRSKLVLDPLFSNILNSSLSSTVNNVDGSSVSIDSLSFFYFNCSGMRSKAKNFYLGILESDYDVIVLTETWLSVDFNTEEFFPPDFCVFRRDRYSHSTNLKGGGVLIAVRRNYFSELLFSDSSVEFIAVKIKLDTSYIIVSTVYFPLNPSTSFCHVFLESISNKLLPFINKNVDFIILGDFNFPDLNWMMDDNVFIPSNTNASSALICDFLASLGASQINKIPNSRGTYLDLFFYTNFRSYKLEACDDIAGSSSVYHSPVSISLYFYKRSNNFNFVKNCTVFDYLHADHDSINNYLSNVNWTNILSNININSSVDLFNKLLSDAIEKFVPKLVIKKSYMRKNPWFTKELKQLEVLRNKCHRKFKRTGSLSDHLQFKSLRSQFCCLNRFLYNNYVIDIEDDIRCNPKRFWRFIKLKNQNNSLPSFMEFKGQKSDNPVTICNYFADYFKSVFVEDISHTPIVSCNNPNIVFSDLDVVEALCNMDASKGPGSDGLPVSFLKHCAIGFAAPLCLLFNLSLKQGSFPDAWKISKVIPIHKSGSRSEVTNYRGIAILSCIPKLFESMVNKVIYFYSKNCISGRQHGFFPGRSTVTNLAVFQNNLINSIIARVQVDVVYTDFAKAFDKLNHRILLEKLSKLNCDIIPLNWLMSYLSNRKMYVKIDDTSSDCFLASSGVPQGSHLGPLLFILFINDVVDCFEYADCILFADDMKIFAKISCELDRDLFQRDLNMFCDWCVSNRMLVNVDKCQVITYSKAKKPIEFNYLLNHHLLRRVNVVKDLGVIFSSDLSFNSHIDAVVNKAYSMLAFIKRNSKDFHDTLTFKSLYTSFVRSQLEYASVIWSPFYDCHSNRIESVQKKFLIFVLKKLPSLNHDSYRLSPYLDRCKFLGFQSLASRRKCLSATFARDIICGKVDCADLLLYFNIYAPQRSLRPRDFLHTPTANSNYGYYGPMARIQRDFNSVENCFDFNISRCTFKRAIAKLLF